MLCSITFLRIERRRAINASHQKHLAHALRWKPRSDTALFHYGWAALRQEGLRFRADVDSAAGTACIEEFE